MKREEYSIYLDGVSCAYSNHDYAVRDITFGASSHEKVAIVGPNGAGKTTLLLAMAGLLEFEGSIYFSGMKMHPGTAAEWRKRIGFLFQNPEDQIFSRTVFDDIAFGLRCRGMKEAEVRARVEESMNIMDVENLSGKSPFLLSQGEKKRVAIAGMLAGHPKMLLMDEPGGGLDPFQKKRLAEYLNREERTIIFTSHDMDFSWKVASRCIILFNGRIASDGPARQVLSDGELLQDCHLELPFCLGGFGMKKKRNEQYASGALRFSKPETSRDAPP